MNKKYGVWIFTATILALFLCFGNLVSASSSSGSSNAIVVKVDGIDKTGDEAKALMRAERRAVFKVLSRIALPDKDPSSPFHKVMEQSKSYIVGTTKVVKKNKDARGVQLICEVQVDLGKIESDLTQFVSKQQNRASVDLVPTIILRTKGTQNPRAYDQEIVTVFNKRFNEYGFKQNTDTERDEINKISLRYSEYDSNVFIAKVKEAMDSFTINSEVAIIGEIRILSIRPTVDGNGFIAEAQVTIEGYDTLHRKIMYDFQEDYKIVAHNYHEAEEVVLHKAAIDASENIAAKTLAYWKNY